MSDRIEVLVVFDPVAPEWRDVMRDIADQIDGTFLDHDSPSLQFLLVPDVATVEKALEVYGMHTEPGEPVAKSLSFRRVTVETS